MKTANVVSVRDRGTSATGFDHNPSDSRIDRMTTLLRCYPQIEEEERVQLLGFLTTGPEEEIVQVTLLQGLEPRFTGSRADICLNGRKPATAAG